MINNILAHRYGKALFDIAKEQGRADAFSEDFALVITSIRENEDFKNLILGRIISVSAKKDLVRKIYTDRIESKLIDFICVCIDKGREKELPAIKDAYDECCDVERGITPVHVSSAVELDKTRLNKLNEAFAKKLGGPVRIIVDVDKSLVGGIAARVGDMVYDGSITGQLERLRHQLHK